MDDWYERYDAAGEKVRSARTRMAEVHVQLAEVELALKVAERELATIFREKNNADGWKDISLSGTRKSESNV